MSLIQWRQKNVDPFKGFGSDDVFFGPFQSVLDNALVNGRFGGVYPAVDIEEDKDSITLKADLPGINKEDVRLSFENGILTLEGERKSEREEKHKNYHRVERSYGSFVRSFNLGTGVDANRIKANYKDGVLEVSIPKSEKAKPKAIDINIG